MSWKRKRKQQVRAFRTKIQRRHSEFRSHAFGLFFCHT